MASVEDPDPQPTAAKRPRVEPSRAPLVDEYLEAGQYHRHFLQSTSTQVSVFLAAVGGTLALYLSVPATAVGARMLACVVGLGLSLVWLLWSEIQVRASSAAHDRARAIENRLGLRLHLELEACRSLLGFRLGPSAFHRVIYGLVILVFVFLGVRTLIG